MYISEIRAQLTSKGINFKETEYGIQVFTSEFTDEEASLFLQTIRSGDPELRVQRLGEFGKSFFLIEDPERFEDFMYVRKSEWDRIIQINESQAKQLKELPGAEVIFKTENGIDFVTYQTVEDDLKMRISDLRMKYYALQYEYNNLYRDFQDGLDEGKVKVKKEDERMVMVWVSDVQRKSLERVSKEVNQQVILSDLMNAIPVKEVPEKRASTKSWKFWGLFK